jgi:hypothetical protein
MVGYKRNNSTICGANTSAGPRLDRPPGANNPPHRPWPSIWLSTIEGQIEGQQKPFKELNNLSLSLSWPSIVRRIERKELIANKISKEFFPRFTKIEGQAGQPSNCLGVWRVFRVFPPFRVARQSWAKLEIVGRAGIGGFAHV